MASDLSFMNYVVDQIGAAGQVSFRKMFGEYAVYCDGKVVALVCDNQFYLKPTAGGRAVLGSVTEASPYPGAKLYWLMAEQLDDRALMVNAVRVTASELLPPKEKTTAKSKAKSEPKAAPRPTKKSP
jgi:DNA transformation protein